MDPLSGLPWNIVTDCRLRVEVLGSSPEVARYQILSGTYPVGFEAGRHESDVYVLYVSSSRKNVRIIRRILLGVFGACPKCKSGPEEDDSFFEGGTEHCVYMLLERNGRAPGSA